MVGADDVLPLAEGADEDENDEGMDVGIERGELVDGERQQTTPLV